MTAKSCWSGSWLCPLILFLDDIPCPCNRRSGLTVSFPGVITFKKADAMRAAAKEIPPEQIMIETDCPFLAPQRVRGKRCEPAYVVDVAMVLAEVKGISLEQVASAATENAQSFFKLI